MNRIITAVLAISLFFLLPGCGKEVGSPGKEKVVAGKNIVVVDATGSTILGYIIDHMDEYDKEKLNYALENAQPDIPFEWENPQAGTSYRFTLFSADGTKEKGYEMAEIYSGNKRLKATAEIRLDPEIGWVLKSHL